MGVGENEWFVASDASAILAHTRSVVYLDDGEMVVLTRKGYHVRDLAATRIEKPVNQIDWDLATIERGGYSHFMLKEIFEQPDTVRNTMRGHLLEEEGTARVSGLNLTDDDIKRINRIVITACGTSWHAGLIGEYLLEELARIPVEVEYASRVPLSQPGGGRSHAGHRDLAVGRDRRHAWRPSARPSAGGPGPSVWSTWWARTIAREVDGGIYLHAGPEIGSGQHQGVHLPGHRRCR